MVPLVEHWDGSSWTQVTVAPGGPQLDELVAVVAPSATDVWAFGYTRYAQHWDGTAWQRVKLPVPKGAEAPEFNGAAAVSPDDIWAVGDAELAGSRYAPRDRRPLERPPLAEGAEPAVGRLLPARRRDRAFREGCLGGRLRRRRHRKAHHRSHAHDPLGRQGVEASAEPEPRDAVHARRIGRRLARGRRRQLLAATCGPLASTTSSRRTATTRSTRSRSTGTAPAGRQVPGPDPGGPTHRSFLYGVAAPSATGVWAVGTVASQRGAARARRALGWHALAGRAGGRRSARRRLRPRRGRRLGGGRLRPRRRHALERERLDRPDEARSRRRAHRRRGGLADGRVGRRRAVRLLGGVVD